MEIYVDLKKNSMYLSTYMTFIALNFFSLYFGEF